MEKKLNIDKLTINNSTFEFNREITDLEFINLSKVYTKLGYRYVTKHSKQCVTISRYAISEYNCYPLINFIFKRVYFSDISIATRIG